VELGSKVEIKLPNISMTVMRRAAELGGNSSSEWRADNLRVSLPDQNTIAGSDSSITVSFTSYENLGSMMSLDSEFSSSVLSVTVLNVPRTGGSIPLSSPLQFLLSHPPRLAARPPSPAPSCVYWDFLQAGWARDGCYSVPALSSPTQTACRCHHLTNFAVLVDVWGVASREDHHQAVLGLLTKLGCGLSILSLAACIAVFSTFRSAKNDRSSINCNLCLTLLLAELAFLLGIGQTGHPSLCAVVAALLQYLFLSSFFWMLIAGFQIYVLLVEVFEPDGSRFVQYYLLGYVAPLLIVLCSLLLDTLLNTQSVYGSEKFCWISRYHRDPSGS